MWRRFGAVVAAIVAGAAITGAGAHRPVTSAPENAAAARAVQAIAGESGAPLNSVVPADFAAVMGYRPVVVVDESGERRLQKPSGTCSAPIGDAWSIFEEACKSHDFGYDLLRYSAASGGELGPWAREALDDQMASDLRGRCVVLTQPNCELLAASAMAAIELNSWRQGYGVPVSEDGVSYGIAAALLMLAFVVPLCRHEWATLIAAVGGGRRSRSGRPSGGTASGVAAEPAK